MNARITSNLCTDPIKFMEFYFRYKYWVNTFLIDRLRTKPSELQKMTISSVKGIELTLRQLWQTPKFWFGMIIRDKNDQMRVDPTNKKETSTLSEHMEFLIENSLTISIFVNQLDQYRLIKLIPMMRPCFESNESLNSYAIQVINHYTWQRGKVISIGKRLRYTNVSMTAYNFHLLTKTDVL